MKKNVTAKYSQIVLEREELLKHFENICVSSGLTQDSIKKDGIWKFKTPKGFNSNGTELKVDWFMEGNRIEIVMVDGGFCPIVMNLCISVGVNFIRSSIRNVLLACC